MWPGKSCNNQFSRLYVLVFGRHLTPTSKVLKYLHAVVECGQSVNLASLPVHWNVKISDAVPRPKMELVIRTNPMLGKNLHEHSIYLHANNNLPTREYPSCVHTTLASASSQPLEQILLHALLTQASTRPSNSVLPSSNLTSPSWHPNAWSKDSVSYYAVKRLVVSLLNCGELITWPWCTSTCISTFKGSIQWPHQLKECKLHSGQVYQNMIWWQEYISLAKCKFVKAHPQLSEFMVWSSATNQHRAIVRQIQLFWKEGGGEGGGSR